MTGEDLLKSLETVYILPNDSLVFVAAKEFSPEVLHHTMGELEKIFPTQKVNLITGVHTVLIERKPIVGTESEGAGQSIHVVDKESPCGCISDFGD